MSDSDIKIIITSVIIILGWYVAHLLTARRERINKRRDLKITYLIEAYRKLELSANRDDQSKYRNNTESAIADIQLFGNKKQIELSQQFSNEIAQNSCGHLNKLLIELRDDLRKELSLDRMPKKINYLRLFDKTQKNNKSI